LPAPNRPTVSALLSDYAEKLHQIETSLAALAKSAGRHSGIVAHVASSVGTAFSIARSASVVVYSIETAHPACRVKPNNNQEALARAG